MLLVFTRPSILLRPHPRVPIPVYTLYKNNIMRTACRLTKSQRMSYTHCCFYIAPCFRFAIRIIQPLPAGQWRMNCILLTQTIPGYLLQYIIRPRLNYPLSSSYLYTTQPGPLLPRTTILKHTKKSIHHVVLLLDSATTLLATERQSALTRTLR